MNHLLGDTEDESFRSLLQAKSHVLLEAVHATASSCEPYNSLGCSPSAHMPILRQSCPHVQGMSQGEGTGMNPRVPIITTSARPQQGPIMFDGFT